MTARARRDLDQPLVSAAAVALRIADFLVATETERVRLFRLHLQATVRLVSPLLPDLAALEGVALTGAVCLIHPPHDWPWRPLYDLSPALLRTSRQPIRWLGAKSRSPEREFERIFANPGVVVRPFADPRGRFAVRPAGTVLGFTAAVGPCVLSAFGSTALLKFAGQLPETLMAAMPGRVLGQVFDHPLFAGRDYMIRRVQPDLDDGMPIVAFRAALVPFAMPWCSAEADGGRG